jgi:hypothetical protein
MEQQMNRFLISTTPLSYTIYRTVVYKAKFSREFQYQNVCIFSFLAKIQPVEADFFSSVQLILKIFKIAGAKVHFSTGESHLRPNP